MRCETRTTCQPNVLETVRAEMAKIPDARFKLVANLPYSVATPVISNLLASDLPPSSMTVTIQKELAERIVARPRTKDYGSFSVWVQSQCSATIVRELAPSVFWPRPKVTSAILQIVLDPRNARRRFRTWLGSSSSCGACFCTAESFSAVPCWVASRR